LEEKAMIMSCGKEGRGWREGEEEQDRGCCSNREGGGRIKPSSTGKLGAWRDKNKALLQYCCNISIVLQVLKTQQAIDYLQANPTKVNLGFKLLPDAIRIKNSMI
jgi:hypothetical protein